MVSVSNSVSFILSRSLRIATNSLSLIHNAVCNEYIIQHIAKKNEIFIRFGKTNNSFRVLVSFRIADSYTPKTLGEGDPHRVITDPIDDARSNWLS